MYSLFIQIFFTPRVGVCIVSWTHVGDRTSQFIVQFTWRYWSAFCRPESAAFHHFLCSWSLRKPSRKWLDFRLCMRHGKLKYDDSFTLISKKLKCLKKFPFERKYFSWDYQKINKILNDGRILESSRIDKLKKKSRSNIDKYLAQIFPDKCNNKERRNKFLAAHTDNIRFRYESRWWGRREAWYKNLYKPFTDSVLFLVARWRYRSFLTKTC